MITRIIPEMYFTCYGTIVKWRAAGLYNNGSMNQHDTDTMLVIWRERDNQTQTYDRIATIELGTCGSVDSPLVKGTSNVYECDLPESLRVTVQPGDIAGVEVANRGKYRFRVYFVIGGGPVNYEVKGRLLTFTRSELLNDSIRRFSDQPQILLNVEAILSTKDSSRSTATTEDVTRTIPKTQPYNMNSTTEDEALATNRETVTTETPGTIVGQGPSSLGGGGVAGGVVSGVVVGMVLLLAQIFLSLIIIILLLYHAKKRKAGVTGGDTKIGTRQNEATLNIEMKGNEAYISAAPQVSTEDNAAYGVHNGVEYTYVEAVDNETGRVEMTKSYTYILSTHPTSTDSNHNNQEYNDEGYYVSIGNQYDYL